MTPTTAHQTFLSTAERRRQLDESTAQAMERYRLEFETLRAKTSRLRAAREARELEASVKQTTRRKPKQIG